MNGMNAQLISHANPPGSAMEFYCGDPGLEKLGKREFFVFSSLPFSFKASLAIFSPMTRFFFLHRGCIIPAHLWFTAYRVHRDTWTCDNSDFSMPLNYEVAQT